MREEIVKLLERENKLSDDALSEIKNIEIDDFSNIVKEVGNEETDYIKKSEIQKDLNTQYIGKELYVFKEVASTNTVAKFLSMHNVANGTVVISEKQTQAKGRSGKSWESPLGGVWLSIISLEKIGVEEPEIKWPNDIMINGKKICGILTEAIAKFNTVENVIIGVGIDANLDVSQFPKELQAGTTTLKEELKREGNENLLIKIFLEEFEKISELFNHEGYEVILKEWRKRSYSIGKIVEVREPFNTYYDGYVVGINKEGALIVEKIDGTLKKVISGECIIKN